MARNTRSPDQRLRDRAHIATGLVRRQPLTAIARELGVTRQQVQYEVRRIRGEWRERTVQDYSAWVADHLAGLDELEREAWEGYERTKAEHRSTRTRQRKRPGVAPDGVVPFPGAVQDRVESEAQVSVEQRNPEVRFLETILKIRQERARVLGLYPDSIRLPQAVNDEPVRRVVVYMERGGDVPGEPLPPGDGPVIDVGAG